MFFSLSQRLRAALAPSAAAAAALRCHNRVQHYYVQNNNASMTFNSHVDILKVIKQTLLQCKQAGRKGERDTGRESEKNCSGGAV